MYFPRISWSLPSPIGNRRDVELSKIRLVFKQAALTKMIFAKYSVACIVVASITLTPVALPFCSSYMIECTTEFGCKFRLPVFSAQGRVAEFELKYPPKGQPLAHKFLAWQRPRPCCK